MSIVSLKNQASWDFGSVSSISGLSPNVERLDPFSNFTGTVVGPISPNGSLREKFGSTRSRIISIDGHHAIVAEEGDTDADRLASSFRSPLKKFELDGGADGETGDGRFNSLGASRRTRNRSTDSGSNFNAGSVGRKPLGHRKSVSFDFGSDDRPLDSNGNLLSSEGDAPLESITEKKSPMVLPNGEVASNDDTPLAEVPPLQLDTSPNATPKLPSMTEMGKKEAPKKSKANDEKVEGSPRLLPQLADLVSSKTSNSNGNGAGGGKRESVLGKLFKGSKK